MSTRGVEQGFASGRLVGIQDALARLYVDTGAVPGLLTMIWRKGAMAFMGTSGTMRPGVPMREDAIFRIYSMTKPVTAVALLMLLEEGRIALDDPVSRFLPEFSGLGVYAGGELGHFVSTSSPRPMKVVDLLRHTSGLTYGILNRTPLDAAYRKLHIAESGQDGGMPAMIDQLSRLPLEFAPAETWNYSVGLDVAGYLVEKISGLAFSQFLQDRIFRPLGMNDTGFVVPEQKRDRLTTCYYVKDGKLHVFDDASSSLFFAPPALESGGAGLVSTAQDYMRFCRMLLQGGQLDEARLLSPKTVQLMTMNQLPQGREMTDMMVNTATFNEAGYAGVGFGLSVAVTENVARTGLPGTQGEYFWGGAAGTYFFNDPKEDMAVVFMSQVLFAPGRLRLRRDLRTLVYGAMAESFA